MYAHAKGSNPAPGSALAIASFNAFSRVRLHPCLPREALRLRSRQHRLPYVIRHVRRPTQEHGEFAPVRFPLELFLRNGGMPPRPIRWRELRKPFPEPLVDLVPCRLERLSRHLKFDGSIRFRNEHFVEFRVKPLANAQQRQEPVVYRGEMSPQIDQAVFPGSDLLIE